MLAHWLICVFAGTWSDGASRALYASAWDVVRPKSNAARVLVAEAAGVAAEYLRDHRPAGPWQLLGREVQLVEGRVDLAWTDAGGRVFFEEVKTARAGAHAPSARWVGQARRYSVAGVEVFGDRFLGTRLVVVGGCSVLVDDQGRSTRLAPEPADPLRPALVKRLSSWS